MNPARKDPGFERLVQKIAPGGRLLRVWPLSGGISAGMTAFELQDADGGIQKLVLRRPGAGAFSQNLYAAEDEYQLLQAARAWGLPVPAPRLLAASGEIFPTACLVLEYIDGRPEFAPADQTGFTAQMAVHLTRIHSADLAGLGGLDLARKTGGFSEGIGRRHAHLNAELGEARIRAVLDAVWPLPAPSAPVLLHGDYWPGNLLWRDGRLVAVIDWEDARSGDPLTDLAISRLDLICIFGPTAMDEFTAQYLALRAVDPAQLPYWDLWAGLRFIRLAGADLAGWAAFYPPVGRPDITAQTLLASFHSFINRALENLAIGGQVF